MSLPYKALCVIYYGRIRWKILATKRRMMLSFIITSEVARISSRACRIRVWTSFPLIHYNHNTVIVEQLPGSVQFFGEKQSTVYHPSSRGSRCRVRRHSYLLQQLSFTDPRWGLKVSNVSQNQDHWFPFGDDYLQCAQLP